MNTPPLLLGAALVFWGWQAGLLPLAVFMAAGLEISRVVHTRWHFSQLDLQRIWKLCTFLFFAILAMALFSDQGMGLLEGQLRADTPAQRAAALNKGARSAKLFFQWLPIAFYPIVAAQAFGQARAISLATFSWILRRRAAGSPELEPPSVNVSYPYFGVAMLAASASAAHPQFFYWPMAFLLVWALWAQRVKRFAPALAGIVVLVVGTGGYAGHFGLRHLQRVVLNLDGTLMSGWTGRDFDPNRHRSLLGSVGRIKKSGNIVLWLKTMDKTPPPELLREAAYNQFTSPVWHVAQREFNVTLPENDQTTWKLVEGRLPERSVRISRIMPGGRGTVAVPNGIVQLENLPVFILRTNTMGALQARGPGFVSYDALYGRQAVLDGEPTPEDSGVPAREQSVIAQVADHLNLSELGRKNPLAAVQKVQSYFAQNFTYSTYLDPPSERRFRRLRGTNRTEIARFLLETRKGHCEYFASATVFLLRQAGIPTRYAVGYSVQEGSGDTYVVRARHAHSWCLAYLNGNWVDIDTTPGVWDQIESARAPWWEPVSDAWSRVWLQVSRLRWSGLPLRKYFLWALYPSCLGLAWLIYKRRQWVRHKPAVQASAPLPGADSEFYLVENRLRELGFDRQRSEPLAAWLRRINGSVPSVPLENLLALHYQYRFDPSGLGENERRMLREDTREWLESTERNRPSLSRAASN